ncbi:MAG: cupredoxin domain-containing protein [Chloroflexi bacterium]|nr:cupredoxin domain-containing protein [Chloroflexota bacterium]
MKRSACVFILFVVLALALTACGGAPSRVQEVQVETTEFKFLPATIQVEAGRPVKLTLLNKGAVEHDLSVVEILLSDVKTTTDSHGHDMSNMPVQPKLHIAAVAGKSSVIEFTPTRPGTYDVLCTVAGHKEAGMLAKLVVK